jgi:hypothetical protein
MRRIILTKDLKFENVPDSNSTWDQISTFALSFDPTLELEDKNIYSYEKMIFNESSTLMELRLSLFLTQRWWNNRSDDIDEESLENVRNLLMLLRKRLTA